MWKPHRMAIYKYVIYTYMILYRTAFEGVWNARAPFARVWFLRNDIGHVMKSDFGWKPIVLYHPARGWTGIFTTNEAVLQSRKCTLYQYYSVALYVVTARVWFIHAL